MENGKGIAFYNFAKIAIQQNLFMIHFGIFLSIVSCSTYHVTENYNGTRFFNNPADSSDQSFSDHIKWMREMKTVKWPKWVIDSIQPSPENYLKKGQLKITYINHATLLIQIDSTNILTDPVFSNFAGPISFLSTKRVRKPGIDFNMLPKIDIILLSHNHFDHMDIPTLLKISIRDKPLIITGLGNKKRIDKIPFSEIIEMGWWQEKLIQSLNIKITFVPALHSSGRGFFDKNKSLWGGFVISNALDYIYFAGDTGYGMFLDEIRKCFPEFRLTIFPIGSYEKRWFMKKQHMNPDDAIRAHILLNSKQSIGMHYATFVEHPEQSIDQHEKDLNTALIKYNLTKNQFILLKFGEGIFIP